MRRSRTAVAAVAAALSAVALSPNAGAQDPPADVAQLAAIVDAGPGVVLLRADGTQRRPVPLPPGVARRAGQLAWSPDGRALAFVVSRGAEGSARETRQVHVVEADGANPRRLTGGRYDESPAWSPDGRRVAFVATVYGRRSVRGSIMVVDADGSGRTRLTVGHWDGEPAWSPDGARIAFTRIQVGGRVPPRVWVMNADGSGARPLARGTSPTWSPDGTRIAFASDRDRHGSTCYHDCAPNQEIYVMRSDGSGETRVTRDKGDDVRPAWSPDGTRIAFVSDRNYPPANRFDLYLVDPDGACVTRVTNSSPGTGGAAWRPGSGRAPRGPCGGDAPGATTPVVDVDLRRARRGALFLGEQFRGMLLSHVEPGLVVYDDCALLRPAGCLGEVQLQEHPVCRRHPMMYGGGPGLFDAFVPRYSWRRGVLLADYGIGAHTDVHIGATTLAVFGPGPPVARPVVDALRPVGAPAGGRLAAPRLPARALRLVRRVQAAHRRLGSVGRVQRALRVSRERVVQGLALGRALRGRRLGPPVRC